MEVYVLRCLRYYGQIEGIFLTLDEIKSYLNSHHRQPSLPENVWNNKNYWNWYKPENCYINDYFHIAKVPYYGSELKQSKTWLNEDYGQHILFENISEMIAVSDDEHLLKRKGLKMVFSPHHKNLLSSCSEKGYRDSQGKRIITNISWLNNLIKREIECETIFEALSLLNNEEIDILWKTRMSGDSWCKPFYIMTLGD
jgi:hypothetical protein